MRASRPPCRWALDVAPWLEQPVRRSVAWLRRVAGAASLRGGGGGAALAEGEECLALLTFLQVRAHCRALVTVLW